MRKLLVFAALALGCCSNPGHHDPDEQRNHFFWPVSGSVFQGFYGDKISGQVPGLYYDEHDQIKMFSGPGRMHRAIDIDASKGTWVYAARDGVAHRYDWDGIADYGNRVLIDHGHSYWTLYAHLDSIHISDGQAIRQGDQIGRVGSTGNSTGPHLHFEVRHGGNPNFYDMPHYVPGNAGDRVSSGVQLSHYYPEP